MKTTLLFVFLYLVIMPGSLLSQTKAITERGEEVILYDDGSWQYVDESLTHLGQIRTNPDKFTKEADATFLVKSKINDIGMYINPKKWTFTKGENNDDAEYDFTLRDSEVTGMLITEKIEIPLISLREIAIENARSAAPDLRIIDEEYRNVNGIDIFMLKMSGTIMGMKFTYFGYYYSNSNGTTQMLCYSYNQYYEKYESEIENFLNGMVLQD